MGILSLIKHYAPLILYVTSIFFFLKAIAGDGRWALLLVTFLIPLRNIIEKIQGLPLGSQMINILVAGALVGCISVCIGRKKSYFCAFKPEFNCFHIDLLHVHILDFRG